MAQNTNLRATAVQSLYNPCIAPIKSLCHFSFSLPLPFVPHGFPYSRVPHVCAYYVISQFLTCLQLVAGMGSYPDMHVRLSYILRSTLYDEAWAHPMTYKAGTFQHAGQLCYVKKKAIYWLLNEAQSLRMKLPCLSWEEKLLLSWYAMPAICSSIAWFMPVSK